MIRQFELVKKVKSYNPAANVDALNRAYTYSMEAHENQTRANGDPYFSHPLEVAVILANMKLDDATIITALLHDTVEDTPATLDEIRKLFGAEIANLVNGVTKLTQLELQSDSTKQAENFRKLVLAISDDLRVLIVKLADRVHNMRTLHHFASDHKRKRIAKETIEIYAPLAERIGIHHFKDELDDLAFKELGGEQRDLILKRLSFLKYQTGRTTVEKIVQKLQQLFEKNNLKAHISGRIKTVYSIWQKIHRKNITLDELTDIMAFRIIVSNANECYQSLGIIHNEYPVISGRFKDFISTPKPNNYQSIHTCVIGPDKQRIEVQIRTEEMHHIAEYGLAAHWQYKEGIKKPTKMNYPWLKSLLEILDHASGPEEFLEHTKLEMFQDQVFCFTPTGELIPLPRGAIAIDFAYAIHSAVGNHCVGVKINDRMMPLRTVLQNGDQVEITTSKTQTPSSSWEKLVVTGKARANIRKFLRTQQRSQFVNLGKSILQKSFLHENLNFSEKFLVPLLENFKAHHTDDLYALIGEGQITPHEIIRSLYPEFHSKEIAFTPETMHLSKKPLNKDSAVSIKGLIPGMAIHYARCCHPLPGDQIIGIVRTGTGVTIHTLGCENLKNSTEDEERWIDITWDHPEEQQVHVGRLNVTLANKSISLATMTSIISKQNANIINLKISHRTEDFLEFMIDLEVRNTEQLDSVIAHLRTSSVVNKVERALK